MHQGAEAQKRIRDLCTRFLVTKADFSMFVPVPSSLINQMQAEISWNAHSFSPADSMRCQTT
jgi:hypothetical protein